MVVAKGGVTHWHEQAAQARARAARIKDAVARERQIKKAEEYDRLAEQAQRLLQDQIQAG
jgi:hypothetical protein